ncbi:hypothetical protein [Streptomyces sp. NPDC019890]|uniref:hypothetical protein n=1 Tax=Streptomyces sp. NPDC019890 TaxID=3365064 RepID=UPI00384B3E80
MDFVDFSSTTRCIQSGPLPDSAARFDLSAGRGTAAELAAIQQEAGTAGPDADELEQGVVDGCSPWTCRGSEVEPVQDDFGLAA